ncbi:MAG: hypothetical protein ACLQNE_38260 [Thermoguttaceae bacterium]
MNNAPPWLDSLREKVGSKTVLLVEGSPDANAVEKWLSLVDPDNRLLVRFADDEGRDREHGGTERVKQGLKHQSGWWGLVDSDERTDPEIAADKAECPRLRFLPRYCLESFFIDPAELWSLLPAIHRDARPELEQALKETVEQNLDHWVAHFAIWRTLREREQRLRKELNFPQGVIQHVLDQFPISRENLVQSLKPWHEHFDPQGICDEYDAVILQANQASRADRLRRYVHGKHFFNRVVVQVLNLLETKKAAAWIADLLAATTIVPPDLEPILAEFIA